MRPTNYTRILLTFLVLIISFNLHAQGPAEIILVGQDIAPFFYIEKEKVKGVYPKIFEKVCAELKLKCRFEVYPIRRLTGLLEEGKVHITAPFVKTPDREELFEFSTFVIATSYSFYGEKALVNKIKELSDMKDLEIGVHAPSGAEKYLKNVSSKCSNCLLITKESDLRKLADKLGNKRFPLIYINSMIADYYIKERKLKTIAKVKELEEPIFYRAAYSKKALSKELRHKIDLKLLELEKNGTIKTIMSEYME